MTTKYTSFQTRPGKEMSLHAQALKPATDKAISLAIHDNKEMTLKYHERWPEGECPICLERAIRQANIELNEEPDTWDNPEADPIADVNAAILNVRSQSGQHLLKENHDG